MDIVVSIKPVLNGVFKFLIYKTFLNYKIDCIYGSFKKKKLSKTYSKKVTGPSIIAKRLV